MKKIADCTPNQLEYGDVINLVFTLVYVEDREDWGPVPFVSHVIRVQHANRSAYPLTSSLVVAQRPPDEGALIIGAVVDGEYVSMLAFGQLLTYRSGRGGRGGRCRRD